MDEIVTARVTEADRTYDETRGLVEDAVVQSLALPAEQYLYVRDIADAWVVVEVDGAGDLAPGQYQLAYTISEAGAVTIDAPVKVQAATSYAPITEATVTMPGRVIERVGDATGARVFHVELLHYGTSRNGLHYPRRVMEAALPVYEGAKAYDHHRTPAELETSTVAGLVGHYRGVTATDRALEADLHLLPGATHIAEALDASLDAQAAGLAPVVGISHDVVGRWKPTTIAGRQVREAVEIVKANSCDIVADPSAGGRATRMVAGGTGGLETQGEDMTLKELLALLRSADATKRAELLKEHSTLIGEWGLDEAAIGRVLTETKPEEKTADVVTPAADAPKELVTAGATEATYARDSLIGGSLAAAAIGNAGISDVRVVEAVKRNLPARFTEAELVGAVNGYATMTRELEAAGLAPVGVAAVTADEADKKRASLDAFFDGNYGQGYRSFKEAFCSITGYNPYSPTNTEDFNLHVLRESIGGPSASYDSASRLGRAAESVTTASWAEMLGDSITRKMVAEYATPQYQAWRNLVSDTPPITDFRTNHRMRMGGYGTLPSVAQGAAYAALTSPTDEEATYSIGKKGGTEDLTIETIANDDVGAVQKIPVKLGRAAAITLYRAIMDILPTNAAIFDAVALFAAGHANTTAVALGGSGADQLRTLMRAQSAYGEANNVLSLLPKYLVVPAALESIANQLCKSAFALPAGSPVGAATDIPNLHQGLEPIVVDHYSDANDWFMIADPALCPTIEVGFYQGRQDPELFTQSDPTQGSMFSNDVLKFKIRHIYGTAVLDYRGFQRGTQA